MMERSRYWPVVCSFCEKKWESLGPLPPHHVFRCPECLGGGKDSRRLEPSPRPNSDEFVAQRDQNVPRFECSNITCDYTWTEDHIGHLCDCGEYFWGPDDESEDDCVVQRTGGASE